MLKLWCGRLFTGEGTFQNNRVVVIKNGTFAAITDPGCADRMPGELIDLREKTVIPGMIDAHTHLGINEEGSNEQGAGQNENAGPLNPGLRVIDGINPADAGLKDAWSGGITTALVCPGSETVIGGQAAVIKTCGRVVDAMIVRAPAGMKMALGENPQQTFKGRNMMPGTRMAIAYMIRRELEKAEAYRRQRCEGREVDPDLDLEALAGVSAGHMPTIVHAHREDDIVTAMRIAGEFNLELVLHHGTAAHRVADLLAEREVPVVVGPIFTARLKDELKQRSYDTPAILHKSGVEMMALTTDHPAIPINLLRIQAGAAVKEGLPRVEALQSITSKAADILGVADRVGRIQPGLDADLVAFAGDPLDLDAVVEEVYIEGRRVYGRG